jgi:PKD repeat protein
MKKTKIKLIFYCLVLLFFNIQYLVFNIPPAFAISLNHIVISEVQITGGSATDEFVELYNPTASAINLSGYRLVKKTSSGTASNLLSSFASFSLPSLGYYLITPQTGYDGLVTADATYSSSSYSMADNGTIILYSDAGVTIVDKVGLGSAGDFEGSVFPTNPTADQSIGRIWSSGYSDTDNNSLDFEIQTPTPKAQNTSPAPPPPPEVYSTKIYFNEIFPSPSTGEEWIEIANGDIVAVNLDGWTIEDTVGTTKVYTIDNIEIDPDGFKVFYKSDTGLTLNNTGDGVILKNPNGEIADQYTYASSSSDKSWSRKEEGVDDWTTDWPTSLGINNIASTNRYPIASAGSNINNAKTLETLNFNGSASSDLDGTIASYDWNFGDGATSSGAQVTHTYSVAGTYQVNLTVRDDKGATATSSITVTVVAGAIVYQNDFSTDIKITEIMPDPVGSDTEGEYIRIYNFGTRDVNLRNWSIDDEDGGSKPFKIDYDLVLKSKTLATFYSTDTKISLNNTGDSTRLFDPDNKAMDDILYAGPIIEGATYALENSKWGWKNNIAQVEKDTSVKKETTPSPPPAPTVKADSPPKTEIKIPDIKKIAVIEPAVNSQGLAQKNEIPKTTTISEVIISSGTLISVVEPKSTPALQKDFISESIPSPQIVQSRNYQKPIVVVPSMVFSLFLVTKILIRPEDWKKIWEKLFSEKKEVKDTFENLFK